MTRELTILDTHGAEHEVTLDLSNQVLELNIEDSPSYHAEGDPPAPSPAALLGAGGGWGDSAREPWSVGPLIHKAKIFDDGLYAAVELAAQNGAGRFRSKRDLLQGLRAALGDVGEGSDVALRLEGALHLSTGSSGATGLPGNLALLIEDFEADRSQSKPLGFYTWSEELSAIYRQDRFLQQELQDPAAIETLVARLESDPELRESYSAYRHLMARLTNRLTRKMQCLLDLLEEERSRPVAVLPPSRSHEVDLIEKLYRGKPVPGDFELIQAMIDAIRDGTIDLEPTPDSGWYDHQTFALEPLVIPDRMPEAERLRMTPEYRESLLEIFRATLALTRETHVKQLEIGVCGAAMPRKAPARIFIAPETNCEPLVSFYRRRAASYRFVRVLLEETFGAPALREMHRPRPQGRASESLATELEEMEAVFEGAEVQSRVDLALRPEPPASGRDPEVARTAFKRYQRGAAEDPDLAEDCRMMVPVAFDEERQRFKCWAVFGWSARTVRIAFATRPTLTIKKKGLFRSKPKVIWGSTSRRAPVPAMAEIWVREPLDRDEFRAICDEHRTVPAIRAALDRGSDGG